jgi:two-component system chemotaxis response regulator CheB
MKHRPMPVIVVSSLTQTGSSKALEALQSGAVDVMAKPSGSYSAHEDGTKLVEKIKAAAQARLGRRSFSPSESPSRALPNVPAAPAMPPHQAPSSHAFAPPSTGRRKFDPRSLILLGASTGGTEALKHVLAALPGDLPGICIVQHIPAYFSHAFASRLNELCQFDVQEARQGDRPSPGLALVAPGGQHMVLRWINNSFHVDLNEGPMVHHQRPAVDVLFDSAVKAGAAPHSLAALLTGMGADGAAGLLSLKQAGAATVAQNEETCVVFGMPREAIRLGAAQAILPLDQIAGRIDRFASDKALFDRP